MAPPSRVHEAFRLRDGKYVADLVQRAAHRRLLAVRLYREVADEYDRRATGVIHFGLRHIIRTDYQFHVWRHHTYNINVMRRLLAATKMRLHAQRFVDKLWRNMVRARNYRSAVVANDWISTLQPDEPLRAYTRRAFQNMFISHGSLRDQPTHFHFFLSVATLQRLRMQRFLRGLRRLVARARENDA